MNLTEEQEIVCNSVITWIDSHSKPKHVPHQPFHLNNQLVEFITIGGYAGTGKTTLIAGLRRHIEDKWKDKRVAFVTYTGKASSSLQVCLDKNQVVCKHDFIGTIHSLIYKPIYEFDFEIQKSVLIGWEKIKQLEDMYDLIFIDESSMVSGEVWEDLRSFGIPIIAVGDHGQLPPINGNFSLMEHLDFELKEVHRQSISSPIIPLSIFVRKNGFIPPNKIFSKSVFKLDWNHYICQKLWNEIEFDESVITLCGFNKSRVKLNNMIRERLGFDLKEPYPNERLICLRNNSYSKLMNGQIGTLIWLMPHIKGSCRMTLRMDGVSEPSDSLVNMSCFGQESYDIMFDKKAFGRDKINRILKGTNFPHIDFFDWGYAISVHKSQGAEWSRVVLFEQRSRYWDDEYYKRWLYTAITRAKERLLVISGFY